MFSLELNSNKLRAHLIQMNSYQASTELDNDVHLNQVCWSRETSKTYRTVAPEDQD